MITLTDEQFTKIVGEVINDMCSLFDKDPWADAEKQAQECSNIAVAANNRANGYNSDGEKVGVTEALNN